MNAIQPQYIEIRKNRSGQERAYVAGTRVRVQDIVIQHERFGRSAEEIAYGLPHLTIAQVYAALTYFFEDREAIWNCIREDAAYVAEMEMKLTRDGDSPKGSDVQQPSISS